MADKSLVAHLAEPISLPCGLKLPNRIVKAAMEEMMAKTGGGPPNEKHLRLYTEWGRGGYGLIITGNVQVSQKALGTPKDIYFDPADLKAPTPPAAWSAYAEACHAGKPQTPAIVQLVHTGRQSSRGMGRSPFEPSLAPSERGLSLGKSLFSKVTAKILFGTPKAMTKQDIKTTIEQFRGAAELARRSGFDGVQIHCSHGYLLAQFMSPEANLRTDEYGATPKDRLRLLFEIVDAIRKDSPPSFCVAVKLNSADYVDGGLTEDDALENVKWIVEHGGVDLIEVSGGTYESGTMLQDDPKEEAPTSSSASKPAGSHTARREAFFQGFASRARSYITSLSSTSAPVIMVTGGFRSRIGMAQAIESKATDLVGLGRPTAVKPDLPKVLLDPKIRDEDARAPRYEIKGRAIWKLLLPLQIIGPGLGTLWHTWQLQRLGDGRGVNMKLTVTGGILDIVVPPGLPRIIVVTSFLLLLRWLFVR